MKKNVVNYIALVLKTLWREAEWSRVVVAVEAKSLALASTKDQNSFCFSSWNQKILSSPHPKNSQMKEETKEKEPPPKENWTPFRSLESTITQWVLY